MKKAFNMDDEILLEEIVDVIRGRQITEYCDLLGYMKRYDPSLMALCLRSHGILCAVTDSMRRICRQGDTLRY